MRILNFTSVFLAVLCFASTSPAHAQGGKQSPPLPIPAEYTFGSIKPSVLADDPRLSAKKVQYINLRLPLGELLEEFHRQSGVVLEARDDQWDDSGRWRVLCCLRDSVTLAEAMDALRSTLSLRGATWQWKRTGTAPDYRYRCVRPQSYESLMDANREAVQGDLKDEIDKAKRGIGMTVDQLKEAAKTDEKGIFASMAKQTHTREGLKAFFTDLSPAQQAKALSGDTVRIPLDMAGDATRTFAENQLRQFREWNPGQNIAADTIKIESDDMETKYTHSLFIALVPAPGSVGLPGYAYTGGVPAERRVRRQFDTQAIIDGDTETPRSIALLQEKIVPPPIIPTTTTEAFSLSKELIRNHVTEECLDKFAKSESPRVNFFACLGQRTRIATSMPPLYEETVGEFLENMKNRCIISKWRGDILTFHYTAGFSNKDDIAKVAPYPLYKMLRDRLNRYAKQRQIPLSDLAEMTTYATEEQIAGLAYEYGEPFVFLEPYHIPNKYAKNSSYAVFKEISTHPDLVRGLESEKGVFVGDLTLALHKLLTIPKGTPATDRVTFRQPVLENTNMISMGYGVFAVFSLISATDPTKPMELYAFNYPVPQTWQSLPTLRKIQYFSSGTRSGKPFYSE